MAKYVSRPPVDLKQPLSINSFSIDWEQVGEIVQIINQNFIRGDFGISYRTLNNDLKRGFGSLEIQEAIAWFRRTGWKTESALDTGGVLYISFHQAIG